VRVPGGEDRVGMDRHRAIAGEATRWSVGSSSRTTDHHLPTPKPSPLRTAWAASKPADVGIDCKPVARRLRGRRRDQRQEMARIPGSGIRSPAAIRASAALNPGW
jgi:hypothetical protein